MEEGQWMSEEQYIRASLNTEEKEDNIINIQSNLDSKKLSNKEPVEDFFFFAIW